MVALARPAWSGECLFLQVGGVGEAVRCRRAGLLVVGWWYDRWGTEKVRQGRNILLKGTAKTTLGSK